VSAPIRVVIADDHLLLRQGLRSLLRLHMDIEILAEVERAADIARIVAENPCDVLLLDLQMDRWVLDDVEALSRVTKVVILTASEEIPDALTAMRLGARAVVHKRFAIETLVDAIRAVAEGLVWMPPALQSALTAQWGGSVEQKLTAREHEIVRYVARGMRNGEVATVLGITEGTVKSHLNNIFSKLKIRDRIGLALYAWQAGLGGSKPPRQ
jgi:DNA-binding NarL/FixJ family response regulator